MRPPSSLSAALFLARAAVGVRGMGSPKLVDMFILCRNEKLEATKMGIGYIKCGIPPNGIKEPLKMK